MKSPMLTSSLLLLLFFLNFIVSCASNSNKSAMIGSGVQLGDKVNAYLMANNANSNTINELLLRYQDSNPEKRQIKLYRDEIASLYSKKVLSVSISTDEEIIKTRLSSINSAEATALFSLFPIDSARWKKLISTHSGLTNNEVYESAIAAGLDPSTTFKASAAGFTNTVTPLINSIGLVIYGQDESSTATVRFREDSETQWREGLNLSWEPIFGSFAGSIVYLNADRKSVV